VELDVTQFSDATSIDLVHPIFGTFALAFDSRESNWDIKAEGLSVSPCSCPQWPTAAGPATTGRPTP